MLGVRQSAVGQAWRFRTTDESSVKTLVQKKDVTDLQARLLVGRGVALDEVEDFLNPTLRRLLPDPSTLVDMDKAATLILDALEAGDNIYVFADYDVDGATSAAQIIRWARHFGHNVGLYIPDRVKEGYGPSAEAFKTLKSEGADLVITLDCGATAYTALEAASNIGLKTVVIDHHIMLDTGPDCAALVNPNRPDDRSGLGDLAAAGVSFMLLVALTREARRRNWPNPPDLLDFLGLTALGTICDVMPLSGLNRAFVSQGLKKMSQPSASPSIIGLSALADVAGTEPPYTAYHGGFIFGPRLNAGGRLGNPLMGAELLITENAQTAYGHAAELDRVNTDRKRVQDDMLREAIDMITPLSDDSAVIVVAMEGWHPGVIGIVAGRLKDRFGRPAIVIGFDEDGLGKGSGRSMKGVNLSGAIHKAVEDGLLLSGGGHAMAAGLSISSGNIDAFRAFINAELAESVQAAQSNAALNIDALLAPSALSFETLHLVEKIGPFGVGNPRPVFGVSNVVCSYAKRLRGGHMRCSFRHKGSGQTLSAICFGADEKGLDSLLTSVDTPELHLAVKLSSKKWQGREQLDIQLIDVALA